MEINLSSLTKPQLALIKYQGYKPVVHHGWAFGVAKNKFGAARVVYINCEEPMGPGFSKVYEYAETIVETDEAFVV